ncbi:MAG: isoprenylcysteine carboxylmethyltransferase family protein [Proteobacteria bacterium]|nr:isoprenylcysteine carboxylmethyltransferase family protein [Pseudomonadota bacterium]
MKPIVRDIIERTALTALTGSMAWRIGVSVLHGGDPVSALVLVGEFLLLFFVIFARPASDGSTSTREWLLAFAGTAAPLLVTPGGSPLLPNTIILTIFLIGIVLQVAAKLNLNRSFGIVPANRGVVTKGFYGIIRHPVYASYFIGHIAFFLVNPTLWNLCIYAIELGFQIARMHAEEDLLSRDPAYANYMHTVRYRLVPGIY